MELELKVNEEVYKHFPDGSLYHQKKKNNIIIISDSFFSKKTKVNDCIRSLNNPFEKMEKINGWNNSSQIIPEDYNFPDKNIVLILESPHTDEYTDDLNPLCPANGRSGIMINKYILNILKINDIPPVNKIIICNPVQWQTSLAFFHNQSMYSKYCFKKLRNDVWTKLWESEEMKLKNCFVDRLVQYNPLIIINACTYDLKGKVSEVLTDKKRMKEMIQIPMYEIHHPASWNIETNQMSRVNG